MELRTIGLVAAICMVAVPVTTAAHGGGLDDEGCHHDKESGEKHCHGAAKAAAKPADRKEAKQSASKKVRLVAVVDGDTIKVMTDDILRAPITVRLLGVDCDELRDGENPQRATMAMHRLGELLTGKTLLLKSDEPSFSKDRYGRLLAYVEANGADAGLQLVREGVCDDYTATYPHPRGALYVAAGKKTAD